MFLESHGVKSRASFGHASRGRASESLAKCFTVPDQDMEVLRRFILVQTEGPACATIQSGLARRRSEQTGLEGF